MPLDSVHKIKGEDATDRITHIKDVDGLTRENAGRLMRGARIRQLKCFINKWKVF